MGKSTSVHHYSPLLKWSDQLLNSHALFLCIYYTDWYRSSVEERCPQVISSGDLVKVGGTVLEVALLDTAAPASGNDDAMEEEEEEGN